MPGGERGRGVGDAGCGNAEGAAPRALVRVFLPTYRRPQLLQRAVASLRAQTTTAWVCEVHNDDPLDPLPARIVAEAGDARIRLVTHERNLGPVATFNLCYRHTEEPFHTLLEDDNSWEPDFLKRMLEALTAHPEATLAWCNQRIVFEAADGRLIETADTVGPPAGAQEAARAVPWGDWRHMMGARHSHGAMLMRSLPEQAFTTPAIPVACVEHFRERMLPHPLLYVPQTLATFTVTRRTARERDHSAAWSAALVLLAASYLRHAGLEDGALARLCAHFRAQSPPMTNPLIAASFVCLEARGLRRHLRWIDWLRFARQLIRHPIAWRHSLNARDRYPDWWALLDTHTGARFAEVGSGPAPGAAGRAATPK